jgi:uncharacterized membrane protein YqiK
MKNILYIPIVAIVLLIIFLTIFFVKRNQNKSSINWNNSYWNSKVRSIINNKNSQKNYYSTFSKNELEENKYPDEYI